MLVLRVKGVIIRTLYVYILTLSDYGMLCIICFFDVLRF